MFAANCAFAQEQLSDGRFLYKKEIIPPDTFLLANLREVYIYPPMEFKNKKQEEFYWRTVRDVKRTLPYAKLVKKMVEETEVKLGEMPSLSARRKYMKEFEKDLFNNYEKELKKMTLTQGKLLIRLIDRECEQTSYELIKIYRGGFTAGFWQIFAKIFGASLKSEYDADDKDKIIERVITLVEAEQL